MSEPSATPLDLTNCENEPIHIPGAIQPHGCLLVLREPDLEIVQVSANVAELLGRAPPALFGRPVKELLGEVGEPPVREALDAEDARHGLPLGLEVSGRAFDATVHRHLGVAMLELEPAAPAGTDAPDAAPVYRAIARLQEARSIDALKRIAVQEVRALTGFDRVMLYRFDADGHGEVWAEACAHDVEPFLGLHYPASDIPRQARELYCLNWLRIIPDAAYKPVGLVPQQHPDTGEPLDLSQSVLRSVSPIHREYMRNMGLRASMSISLMQGETLWGLISCGHRAPRKVSHSARHACRAIGRMLSLQIEALTELEDRRVREAAASSVSVLAECMREASGEVLPALAWRPDELLAMTDASGAAILAEGGIVTLGYCPSHEQIRGLIPCLEEWIPEDGVLQTHKLEAEFPPACEYRATASGLLAVSLPRPGLHAVLWFRPEEVQTVYWGGDPSKPVEPGPGDDSHRLHPRRSFAAWQQEVRGQARRWRRGEVLAALDLRDRALEIDLMRQVNREQRAVRARDELMAIVSHDLGNPIAAVTLHASLIQREVERNQDIASSRVRDAAATIVSTSKRMQILLRDLVDASRLEAGRFDVTPATVSACRLIEDACELFGPLAKEKRIWLVCSTEPDLWVRGDAARLFQVMANLVGNAIKFTPEQGRIEICARRAGNDAEILVRDTGVGIPADQLPHVFDRYTSIREPGYEGAGLGLFIARGIVNAHGGELRADSEPGRGSTFRFTVPLESRPAG